MPEGYGAAAMSEQTPRLGLIRRARRMAAWLSSPRALALVVAFASLGCQRVIGDECTLSTDCSQRGDRQCDTSQPGGYCTIQGCRKNSCPDEALCVTFRAQVPGCSYDDRGGTRLGRSYCVKYCESDTECRSGYVCRDPREDPWQGRVLDTAQGRRGCLVPASSAIVDKGNSAVVGAAVCDPAVPAPPDLEAQPGAIVPATPVVSDAGTDATTVFDAGTPEPDAGLDAGTDAADAGSDAPADAPPG